MCTAPEVLRIENDIDYKAADIYQMGMVIYHVLYKTEPFTDLPMPVNGITVFTKYG